MASTSPAPFPYRDARSTHLHVRQMHEGIGNFPYFEEEGSLPVIDADTYSAWRRLELLFPDANTVEPGHPFGIPARMEFFWDPNFDSRGVAFFDDKGHLIIHVLHALLGYGGSGPMSSKQIMLHLGVSEEMFQDIQSALWDQRPYKVVLSRERHDILDEDVEFVAPGAGILSDWEWWRVR